MKYLIIGLSMFILSCQPSARQNDHQKTADSPEFASLIENERIADFSVEALYETGSEEVLGARFRHISSGFVLDFLRIQSVPQAFMWVNTHPVSDQGEPHTLEHLLLGKGNQGRYVASLENMSLGNSSAFTMQLRTCYHFNTAAGSEVFFNLFEAKLNAMLNPNFSDEEIRREVRNMGISADPVSEELFLEEKGTVYNEMVSSFDRPYSDLYFKLNKAMYGDKHPVSYSAGGFPANIRTMIPEDIRKFHSDTHHLNNMGCVVAIPDELDLQTCLDKFSTILASVEKEVLPGLHPDDVNSNLPLPEILEPGKLLHTSFPNENPDEPGVLLFSWPASLSLSPEDGLLLDLFLQNLGRGQTSNLYKKFIDTKTRVIETGSTGTYAYRSDDIGSPVLVGLQNISRESGSPVMMDSIRSIIIKEIKDIADFADGSPELLSFNERIQGRILETRKFLDDFLNSPPRFGYRSIGSNWMDHLTDLHRQGGFRRSLVLKSRLEQAEIIAASSKNHWSKMIEDWQLLTQIPYGISTLPDPAYQDNARNERTARIKEFTLKLQQKYNTKSEAQALEQYQKEYAANTDQMEQDAGKIDMPGFIDNPPLSLDETLQYTVESMPGGGRMVYSRFDNLSGATVGLAFNMYVVPESELLYAPILPLLLTQIGTEINGEKLTFEEMQEKQRREILRLDVHFDSNIKTERVELVVEGAGSNLSETQRALEWMEAVITAPDISISNLSRINDVIDQALANSRNRIRGSEESWVNNPADAFRTQHNPLYLSASSFLTQSHAFQRIRWQLKTANAEELMAFHAWVESTSVLGARGRLYLEKWLEEDNNAEGGSHDLIRSAIKDLGSALSDIPDENLAQDWKVFCQQLESDLTLSPDIVLERLQEQLALITHQDNARGYLISNAEHHDNLSPLLNSLCARLNAAPSNQYTYDNELNINRRLMDRYPDLKSARFVGFVNNNSSSGVHINNAPLTDVEDVDKEQLLNFLSAKLYGGGGAHSMFMKTWGAGLAYSNGLGSNERGGYVSYYAERCPDLAQTMQFVINELEDAAYDSSLGEYAVAQAFSRNRSGGRFEDRGRAMAADLADGLTPEKVAAFRKRIIELGKQDDLYELLRERMENTYGKILPGYGPLGMDTPGATYFHIAPERLLDSYEKYLRSVEGDVQLIRLYPRDFWLENSERNVVMP
ncbi:hypothetical protein HQ531_00070 [bacterium]|nr:hypothetical protein [bacterium]